MRVALVVPGGVDRSGEYRVIPALLALIERLALLHDVQVFALRQEAHASSWELAGARVHNVGAPFTRVRAIAAICNAHRTSHFDLVHAIWSGACGVVAVTAATLLGIPKLIHVAGGELVCLREIGYGGSLTWRGRVREKLVLRAASIVTAASPPIIAAVELLGVTVQCVPLGVDLRAWPPRAPRRRGHGQRAQLIHVASLNRVKDQSTLLLALSQLAQAGRSFGMDIVGEDTLNGEVQALAERLGISGTINFRGFLPQRALRALVESADLMVMTSRHEAGPMRMQEGAEDGGRTGGTAVGHIVDWAPLAASCVAVGDAAALACALGRLLDDEEQRLQIAGAAQARATRADADHTAQRFQALYEAVVAR